MKTEEEATKYSTEAKQFLDVMGQKVLEFSFLLFTATSTNGFYTPDLRQKWFETVL